MVEKDSYGKDFPSFKIGDLHAHTAYSQGSYLFDGSLLPQQLVEKAVEEGLHFLAITDHDTVAPSFVGKEHALVEGYDIDVITGAEISSKDGHILALGIETNIPFWMSAEETVRAVHREGGIAVAAHPFYTLTDSVGEKVLRTVAENEDPEVFWDGIEVFNAGANDWRFVERTKRFGGKDANRRAREFYTMYGESGDFGAALGGSDAHNKGVGRTVTTIPAQMEVFQAIQRRETGVKMMDGREEYTIWNMYETKKRSATLEKEREGLPHDKKFFPLREASSQRI